MEENCYVCVHECMCVHACVRMCVRACVRAYVCAFVRMCVLHLGDGVLQVLVKLDC